MKRIAASPSACAQRGFSLIELMIAVVVIAVIAAVAFPSYQNSIRKSRRSDAYAALSTLQLAQERCRANNPSYCSSITNATTDTTPGLALQATSPSGYYTLSLSSVTATGYTALATPVSGTTQASDSVCTQLQVRVSVGNIYYGSYDSGGTLDESQGNRCWVR